MSGLQERKESWNKFAVREKVTERVCVRRGDNF